LVRCCELERGVLPECRTSMGAGYRESTVLGETTLSESLNRYLSRNRTTLVRSPWAPFFRAGGSTVTRAAAETRTGLTRHRRQGRDRSPDTREGSAYGEAVPVKAKRPRRRRNWGFVTIPAKEPGHRKLAQLTCAGCPLFTGPSVSVSQLARDNLRSSAGPSVRCAPLAPKSDGPRAGGSKWGSGPGARKRDRRRFSADAAENRRRSWFWRRVRRRRALRPSMKPRVLFGSTGMPGPMVVAIVAFLT